MKVSGKSTVSKTDSFKKPMKNDTYAPTHILQGMADPDVPWRHALNLVEHMSADPVTLSFIADGDHRLSRPQDLAKLAAAIDQLDQSPAGAGQEQFV